MYHSKSLFILPLLLILSTPLIADHERHIHVNGEHLDANAMTQMDQLFQGKVSNGFYWLNRQTGEWGYEDNETIQGVIEQIAQTQQRQPSPPENLPTRNSSRPTINNSQNGSVVLGGEGECSYVTAGGMTFRSC